MAVLPNSAHGYNRFQAYRYQGNNRGGWVNQTLDGAERNRQVIGMLKIIREEVLAIPIHFNFAPTAHLSSLKGPQMGARVPDPLVSWNLHEWEWR